MGAARALCAVIILICLGSNVYADSCENAVAGIRNWSDSVNKVLGARYLQVKGAEIPRDCAKMIEFFKWKKVYTQSQISTQNSLKRGAEASCNNLRDVQGKASKGVDSSRAIYSMEELSANSEKYEETTRLQCLAKSQVAAKPAKKCTVSQGSAILQPCYQKTDQTCKCLVVKATCAAKVTALFTGQTRYPLPHDLSEGETYSGFCTTESASQKVEITGWKFQ
jgi:hypothetical protein